MTSVGDGAIDLAQADFLLSTTRAVRRRLDFDRPVDREVLLDCVRLAQQAPTGSNAQGWSWVIVTDSDKRAALAAIYRDASAEVLVDAAVRVSSDPAGARGEMNEGGGERGRTGGCRDGVELRIAGVPVGPGLHGADAPVISILVS